MERKQLMSWFIIIVMVGSILGFAIIASQGRESPPPEPPPIDAPTVISFKADDVDANVAQMFPSMFLTCSTNETDIERIDSDIYSIEGIKRINSFYRRTTDEAIEGALLYIGEIGFAEGYVAKELLEEIKKIDYLYGTEAYALGLVALPPTVILENSDLNLTKEHTFNNPLSQAYLSIDTIKGDSLIVSLEVGVAGERETGILAFESYNLTAAPKAISLTEELQIDSLQPKLFFEGRTDYSNSISVDFNKLEKEIIGLEHVESLSMHKSDIIFPSVLIELDGNYEALEQDISNLLNDLNGITNSDLYLDQSALSFDFDLESDFPVLKSSVLEGLQDLGIGVKELNEPEINVTGDLNIASEDAAAIALSLSSLFDEKNLEVEVRQYAYFTVDSFTGPDTNNMYVLDVNKFGAKIMPTHNLGEKVELDIFFYGIRGRAVAIQAEEVLLGIETE